VIFPFLSLAGALIVSREKNGIKITPRVAAPGVIFQTCRTVSAVAGRVFGPPTIRQ